MQAPEPQSTRLEDLNEDLLTEILCRLPYRQVALCKCVSKKWFFLIFNPHFVSRFSSINKPPWSFIYSTSVYWEGEIRKEEKVKVTSNESIFKSPGFSLRFLPSFDSYCCILKTYKDLVLCSITRGNLSTYYVCNPLTMQWVSLPPSPDQNLALPSCFDFVCEFTKDHRKKHHQHIFKVVYVPRQVHSTKIKVRIFSSDIGQWNELSSLSVRDDIDRSIMFREVVIHKEKLILFGCNRNDAMIMHIIIDDIFNGGHVIKITHDDLILPSAFREICRVPHVPQGAVLLFARASFKHEHRPLIKIWELREEDNYKWRLVHEVCLKDVVSEDEWVLKNYLKRTSWTNPSVLGFDPYDVNILYLNLYCENRMGKYDIQRSSLNIVDHAGLPSKPGVFDGSPHLLILQSLPTPVLPPPQFVLC